MSTVRIVLLAALGLLALCAVVFGLSEGLRSEDRVRSVVPDPVRRIVVMADAGDVDLRAGLTSAVVIARHEAWLLHRPSFTQRLAAGTLTIRADCGGLRTILRCRTDLQIDAPPEVDVAVRTDAGSVDLRGLSGRADVRTKSGDIRMHRLEPVTVKAMTSAGNVDLDLFGQPARAEAHSSAGDVLVTVPYGPYRVDAETRAGNVKVQGIIRDDLAPQAISALTGAGDIVVRAR